MGTWAGAIIETQGRADFAAIAARHGVVVHGEVGPWALVACNLNLASGHPPPFAGPLSRDLGGDVLGVFFQGALGVEQLEQWHKGELVRSLSLAPDGAWEQRGTPQSWEVPFFFGDQHAPEAGEHWPSSLRRGLSDADLERARRAWAEKTPGAVLDLFAGGDFNALWDHFGVDGARPVAHFTPPTNWKPWAIAAVVVVAALGPASFFTRLQPGLEVPRALIQSLALVGVALGVLIIAPLAWLEWRRRRRHLHIA